MICFSCGSKSKAYKARLGYLRKVYNHNVVEHCLPVFVGAGIANVAEFMIGLLNDDTLEVVAYLLYALFCCTCGKLLYYYSLKDDENPSMAFFFRIVRKHRLSQLLRNSISETAGFSLKSFFVNVCLGEIFTKYGLGPAFGSWLMVITTALLVPHLNMTIFQRLLHISPSFNGPLIGFDYTGFLLSISFILAVIIVLAINQLGYSLVPQDSFLYEWRPEEENGDEEEQDDGGPNNFLNSIIYSFGTVVIASLLQIDNSADSEEEIENSSMAAVSSQPAEAFTVTNPISGSEPEIDAEGLSVSINAPRTVSEPSIFSAIWSLDNQLKIAYLDLYNGSLGYFAGVAFYAFVFSFQDQQLLAAIIGALILSYFTPCYIAALAIRIEMKTNQQHSKKITEQEEVMEGSGSDSASDIELTSQDSHGALAETGRSPAVTVAPAAGDKSSNCSDCCFQLSSWYTDLRIKQISLRMMTIRLSLGWTWESILRKTFDLLGTQSLPSLGVVIFCEILYAILIILIVVGVHFLIRDWVPSEEPPQVSSKTDTLGEDEGTATTAPVISPVTASTGDDDNIGPGNSSFGVEKDQERGNTV